MGCSTEVVVCDCPLLHFDLQPAYLQLFLNWGANPNVQDSASQKTALHLYQANLGIVEMLIKMKADVNLPDSSGDTPLHITARTGRTAVAEILLKNHASVSKVNHKNQTALDTAAALGHSECFKCMFTHATERERSSQSSDGSKKWKEAFDGLESKCGQVDHEKIQELAPEQ